MSRLNKGDISTIAEQIEQEPKLEGDFEFFDFPINMENTVSTGSTLLDLAISGSRKRGGGIPGGIILEVFGANSTGKTQLMGEICADAQSKGGKVRLGDPEAKFDPAYAERYGFHISPDTIYMPDTPADVYREIHNFQPTGDNVIDVIATDSIAALIASAEMGPDELKKKSAEDPLIADKMGGMKPKEIHALIRKATRRLRRSNILCIFTNQQHDSMAKFGAAKKTSGGNAIPYYASIRIELKYNSKITEKVGIAREVSKKDDKKPTMKRVEHEKVIGIECTATCVKNHIDDPYREAPLRVIFGYGFDDIGSNLQWLKDNLALNTYLAVDKEFTSLSDAIRYTEENNKEKLLKEMVIVLWQEIETKFRNKIKRKERLR